MEKIEFGAEKLPGYIAGPVGAPGVICLQEAWGVTDEMKEFSIKIASKGYRVLLPDLYKVQGTAAFHGSPPRRSGLRSCGHFA